MYPRVEIIPVLEDNYVYLLHEREGRGVAVIDPGDARRVIATLESRNLRPLEIWLTHKHQDHIGGAAEIARRYDLSIRGPEEIPDFTARVMRVRDGISFNFGPAEVSVWTVPGHTAGHVIYYVDGALFCGDVLFIGGCGRIFEGEPEDLHRGISDRILALPDHTRIYCGHEYAEVNLRFALELEPGNQTIMKQFSHISALRRDGRPSVPGDLGIERLTNPFLRVREPALQQALRLKVGDVPSDPARVFRALRKLRNAY